MITHTSNDDSGDTMNARLFNFNKIRVFLLGQTVGSQLVERVFHPIPGQDFGADPNAMNTKRRRRPCTEKNIVRELAHCQTRPTEWTGLNFS